MQVIRLDPFQHKTFHFWHVFVRGCGPGIFYAFRVDGPRGSTRGPPVQSQQGADRPVCARAFAGALWKRADAVGPEDNLATSMRCAVVDPSDYDWEGDRPLKRPIHESIIYEVHVGGFTRSPSAGVHAPGHVRRHDREDPHLQALGITAVELLPVCEFDDSDVVAESGRRADSQLLGLQHGRVLQPALGLLRRPRRRRRT